ncbi:DCC1-like thiol-disulfide oxidoreductase family protein [Flavobacteriaceae bacterium 3-367]|uniref:thiol-disulfide oxidoreductase DCC family protein n=1 Tax=Eudoraea algarum TaxID=3417568 RepID=UPI003282A940
MNSNPQTDLLEHTKKNIIFFDGVCNLCNGFVDFVIRRDKKMKLHYASLQQDVARRILKEENIVIGEHFSTIYYYHDGKLYKRSTAILRILKELTWPYRAISFIGFAFPPIVRNWVYDFLSRNRYRFFGKRETCRLPSPEEKKQFL